MRVAYLNADCGIPLFGDKGASIHVQEMVRAFQECGSDIRVVATRIGDARPQSFTAPYVHAIANRDVYDRLDTRPGKERLKIADASAAFSQLQNLYRDWPFDMIYERYSLWSRAGVDAACELGVPLILEVNAPLVREQGAHRELGLVDEALSIEQLVFSSADAIVTVSGLLRDYVISRGAHPNRVSVTGNAVDTSQFHPHVQPVEFGLPAGSFVIGFTGSLKKWHGVDVMMEAFRLLRREAQNAHLLIVGDGPKRGWIEGFIQGAGLENAVTMTGWLSHAELPGAISTMDVALAPYPETDDFYFSPLKLFEYLAIGKPVVASGIGQIAEIITSGDDGILVPPGDFVRMARALLTLRADPRKAARIGRAAAALGARHTWVDNAEAVLALASAYRKAA